MNRPLYIFDLDGTLALTQHRAHFLADKDDSNRWRKFYAACVDDKPNASVVTTLTRLIAAGAEVWIFSGRSREVETQTAQWLDTHVPAITWELVQMRDEGDHSPDEELKQRWLNSMLVDDRERLTAVFDDRAKVVAMWRANGVTCFQVAYGDF